MIDIRRNICWFVAVVAAALVQTTWLDAVRVAGVLPDLILLFVVYFAIAEGEEQAMFTGALGGVFQDIAGDAVLGHHVICNVITGYFAARVVVRLITEHPVAKVVMVLLASILNGLLFTAIQYVQRPDFSTLHSIAARVIPGSFYTTLVTPLVFLLLDTVFRRLMPPNPGTVS